MVQEMQKRDLDRKVILELVDYAHRLTMGNPLGHAGTLGNIAVRKRTGEDWVCYTKRRGISLEEITAEDISVIAPDSSVLYGEKTSGGVVLNLEIFKYRPGVNAAIHLHPKDVIALFSAYTDIEEFPYVSIGAPRELGSNPVILKPEVNIEADVSLVKDIIQGTDAIIMPRHGVTTIGASISQAYNRMTALVNEVMIISEYLKNCNAIGIKPEFLEQSFVKGEYEISKEFQAS